MRDTDYLRLKVLRAFGVAPWSREAEGLTEELCLYYAAFLESEEEKNKPSEETVSYSVESGVNFDHSADFGNAASVSQKSGQDNVGDVMEREMRCRDSGFIIY
ncbi:MAG: hypothetical protein HUJ66_07330 [Oscillospiraceae bacterium]|nr:hypothetical protein [Oscillospiraceae bacterium]